MNGSPSNIPPGPIIKTGGRKKTNTRKKVKKSRKT